MALSPFYFDDLYRPSRLFDQHFGLAFTPDDLTPPLSAFANYYRPWRTTAEDSSSTVVADKDKLRICLDVQQFRPNEITVKTTAKQITIEGKHEERQDEHGLIARQFIRKYSIPDDYESDDVASSLTSDGVLIIEAKKKASRAIGDKERIVPINKIAATCQKSGAKKDTAQSIKDSLYKTEMTSKIKEENGTMMAQFEQNGKMQKIKEESLSAAQKSESLQVSDSFKDDFKMKSAAKEEKCSLLNADGTLKFSSDSTEARAAKCSSVQERMDFSSSSVTSEMTQSKESSFTSTEMSCGFRGGEKASDFISDIINAELKQAADNL